MTDSKIDVASQALARLGEPSISSFEEDSDTAEKVAQLYEPTILQLLGMSSWTFATKRVALAEDASASATSGWQRGFLLPTLRTDRVGKPLAFYASANANTPKSHLYQMKERWVYTNEAAAWCEYVYRAPENLWPGYFQTLAIEALAAVFALPITENASKEQLHRQIAYGSPSQNMRGGLFKVAEDADQIGDTTPSILDDHDPIASARFGGNF